MLWQQDSLSSSEVVSIKTSMFALFSCAGFMSFCSFRFYEADTTFFFFGTKTLQEASSQGQIVATCTDMYLAGQGLMTLNRLRLWLSTSWSQCILCCGHLAYKKTSAVDCNASTAQLFGLIGVLPALLSSAACIILSLLAEKRFQACSVTHSMYPM